MKTGRFISLTLIVLTIGFIGGAGGAFVFGIFSGDNNRVEYRDSDDKNDGNKIVTDMEVNIERTVSKVGKSVVSIVAEGASNGYYTSSQSGTGIIVTDDGYILTNKHVVKDGKKIAIVLADGTKYDNVKLVGLDPLNDLAFLKVDGAKNLPAASLGNSSTVRAGQQVVAIGNALGQYHNSVTSGIISGKGRPVSAQSDGQVSTLSDLIQTDAAINPGNSGGPLSNLNGQVIGINTAMAKNAQSIGFSIPINAAKGVLKNLKKTGKVERAFLGVNYIAVTPEVADYFKLSTKAGAYVYNEKGSAITSGGPADKAGIKSKDVITKVNGIKVGEQGDLSSLVGEYAPGEKIELEVKRGKEIKKLEVTLTAYSTDRN